MAHYLVTGGAGFIGSHLCEELSRRGERVRVVDSLITGKRANLAHVPNVEFIEGDLADFAVARPCVRHRLCAAPGGDSVGPAIGRGSDHVEPRQHRRVAEPAGRGAGCRCEAVWCMRARHRHTAIRQRCPKSRRCRRRRSRHMRCRSLWPSSIARCSPRYTGSRR